MDEREFDTPEYRQWRYSVFARDGFTCQMCGEKKELEGHHIKRWADFPALRYSQSNGITLCKSCHSLVTNNEDTYRSMFESIVKVNTNAKYSKDVRKISKVQRRIYKPRNSRLRY